METADGAAEESPFGISLTALTALSLERDVEQLAEVGGIDGLAEKLLVSFDEGLPQEESEDGFALRKATFGTNTYPDPPRDSFLDMLIDAAKDTTIIILSILALVALALAMVFQEEGGWIEPVAIMAAVVLVTFVTAGNNYSKELQFRKLNKVKEDRQVKVVRGGQRLIVSIFDVCVGDSVILESGDQVPADGVFIDGFNLETDESNMTGETDMVKKSRSAPFMLSGCQVNDGTGRMLVLAVGENSEWGMAVSKLQEPPQETPLQEKLNVLAAQIGKGGLAVAILTFLVLTISWVIRHTANDSWEKESSSELTHFFLIAVTIVVVAVPEGLPLAVTISLAYSMKKMMKDNNLVRHLSACETMGGATNICSDKTGTLTENRMTVTSGWFSGVYHATVPSASDIPPSTFEDLCEGISVNSKAHVGVKEDGRPEFQGNKTECALLYMIKSDFDYDYHDCRVRHRDNTRMIYTFSSDRKRMGTMLSMQDGSYRLYCKGAAEIVLALCDNAVDREGESKPLTAEVRAELEETIVTMASSGLRTICLAMRDFDEDGGEAWENSANTPEEHMTVLAIVGIKDPLRKEVYGAVEQCKKSGIMVRMVTGDNILTAQHIARECGILDDSGVAMEGRVFRELPPHEMDILLPRLQVLARSTPSDKHMLVKRLKALGEVVAVTGDGTNDAPALKEADVGLSMGLSGTEVAKEASDIVILDDNFSSIVRAVLWGRSVFENIRKFLQFQLTVNFVALTLTFVAALSQRALPLTAVQLLWVNLIMDTFAALALATEPPVEELLDRKPYGRYDPLITSIMIRNLVGQGIFQLAVLFTIVYAGHHIFDAESESVHLNTIVFNSFVMCQLFNEINSRKINDENNIFENIHKSSLFIIIMLITFAVQILIVTFGGGFTQTTSLTFVEWLACIFIGSISIPIGFLVRLVPVKPRQANIPDDVKEMLAAQQAAQTTGSPTEDGQEMEDVVADE